MQLPVMQKEYLDLILSAKNKEQVHATEEVCYQTGNFLRYKQSSDSSKLRKVTNVGLSVVNYEAHR
jgi:hypothetical protein